MKKGFLLFALLIYASGLVAQTNVLEFMDGDFVSGNFDQWRYDEEDLSTGTATISEDAYRGNYAIEIVWKDDTPDLADDKLRFDHGPNMYYGCKGNTQYVFKSAAKATSGTAILKLFVKYWSADWGTSGELTETTWLLTDSYVEHEWAFTIPAEIDGGQFFIGYQLLNTDGSRWPVGDVTTLIDEIEVWETAVPVSGGAPIWNPAANSSSTGLWNESANWSDGRVPHNNKATFKVPGSQECVLKDSRYVSQIAIGDGDDGGTLRVADGGTLNTTASWSVISWDAPGTMIVDAGGTVNFAERMLLGYMPTGDGIVILNGGTINVPAKTELGTNGKGTLYVNSGVLNLANIDPTLSIKDGSLIDISGGEINVGGNHTAEIDTYVAASKIIAKGGDNFVSVVYDADNDKTVVTVGLLIPPKVEVNIFEGENGGFETGDATNWQSRNATVVLTVKSDDVSEGSYAMELSNLTAGANGDGLDNRGHRVAVTAGQTYTLRLMAKSNSAGVGVLSYITYYNASGDMIDGEGFKNNGGWDTFVLSTTYQEFEYIRTAPADAVDVGVGFMTWSNVPADCIILTDDWRFTYERDAAVDATLSDLAVDGTTIDVFDAATTEYNIELPYGAPNPTVTASTTDVNATSVVTDVTGLPGDATVVVTAEDEINTSTYTIHFTVAAPNDDATLSDLAVDGTTIDVFDAATLVYNIELAVGTTDLPTVTATITDVNASVVVTNVTSLPGDATAVVTAEDETTTSTYTIHFTVAALNDDATLNDLAVDGTTIDVFDAATLVYNVELAAGTTDLPTVTATTTDVNASVVVTNVTSLPGDATVVVTAEDEIVSSTYTVHFTVAVGISDNDVIVSCVYPNPTNGEINISLNSDIKNAKLALFNITGKTVFTSTIHDSETSIDLSEYGSGIYFLKIEADNKIYNQKVVLK